MRNSIILLTSLVLLLLTAGCKKDKDFEEEKNPVHFVGEKFGGGIIFYLFPDSVEGQHGLIVSLDDISTSASWGLYLTNVPNCESFWNGKANTTAIVAIGGLASEAAGLCDAYSNEGFDDWYLPAFDELSLLYENVYIVNKVLESDGLSATNVIVRKYYWSSTESNSDSGLKLSFLNGSSMADNKYEPQNVRAIRTF
jgi:hypothetical protein